MDNVDNTDNIRKRTTAPPVWCFARPACLYPQQNSRKPQHRPNIDNVDTDGRRCVSVFAPLCVHIYKGHQSHHPPRIGEYIDKRPAEGVQLSRPPDMNDTDNEGKASTDEKETDPDTDNHPPR